DEFLKEFIAQAENLLIGNPSQKPEPFMGPLISDKAGEDLLKAQAELEKLGAKVLLKSKTLDDNKALVTPAVLDCTSLDLDDEEVFGPLVRILRVDSFDDAVFESNKTKFGLASGLVSDSKQLYENFISESKAGIINWNRQITGAVSSNPFGGVGASGNYRPSAYFAADYCAFPVASIEKETVDIPANTPPGLNL
ncbi:MAG: aldehyde dehydrogenase family protein, partial [Lentisphaeraceae bacterium]|nr:aldehyde dehydrogenase family protein [Lentisphaeraceae bacterium]